MEFNGELSGRRRVVDVGVDPGRESLQDAPALGVVAGVLGVVERAAELEQPRDAVVMERLLPKHLAQPPLARPPVHFHLPETVLGLDEALGEEEVVEVGGVDVGHPPGVAQHFDFALESGDLDAAVDLRQLRLCQVVEARAGSFGAGGDEGEEAECGGGRDAAGMPDESRGSIGAHGFLPGKSYRWLRLGRRTGVGAICCGAAPRFRRCPSVKVTMS